MTPKETCSEPSLDYFVGDSENAGREAEAKCLGGLQVDHKLVLGRLLHRQFARLGAFQNAVHITSGAAVLLSDVAAMPQSDVANPWTLVTTSSGLVAEQEEKFIAHHSDGSREARASAGRAASE
jgi:hypothetical protein